MQLAAWRGDTACEEDGERGWEGEPRDEWDAMGLKCLNVCMCVGVQKYGRE